MVNHSHHNYLNYLVCYFQYANFLSLNDKKSLIVGAVICVHTSRREGEIKAALVLKRLLHLSGT